jgi:hypothetical protein
MIFLLELLCDYSGTTPAVKEMDVKKGFLSNDKSVDIYQKSGIYGLDDSDYTSPARNVPRIWSQLESLVLRPQDWGASGNLEAHWHTLFMHRDSLLQNLSHFLFRWEFPI